MRNSNPFFYMLVLTATSISCGEDKNVCEKAVDVKMSAINEMCNSVADRDECNWWCPCICVDNNREFVVIIDEQGLPDLSASYCVDKASCGQIEREDADRCLQDPDSCAASGSQGFDVDFSFYGIPFCGPSSPISEPFPEENCTVR